MFWDLSAIFNGIILIYAFSAKTSDENYKNKLVFVITHAISFALSFILAILGHKFPHDQPQSLKEHTRQLLNKKSINSRKLMSEGNDRRRSSMVSRGSQSNGPAPKISVNIVGSKQIMG
jgi:hypothetical protein